MELASLVLVPPWLAASIAVAASLLAWRTSLPLLKAGDGPTLPERAQRWRGQHRFVSVVAYLPLFLSGAHALWAFPLVWFGLLLTTHRVRRRLFGDTWSLAAHVEWNARLFAGAYGSVWSLALAPMVLVAAGASRTVLVAAAILQIAWLYWYNDILIAILGARPVDDPALLTAFEPVLAQAQVPRPRLVQAGPRGALAVNAFALAAYKGDAVLFLDGLLAHVTPVEATAILAHEIGHLEDFARRRWQVYSRTPLLVVGGLLLSLSVVQWRLPIWYTAAWFLVVFVAVAMRAVRSQQRESESDRRAVELCGDGEALIRGLVTIHTLARVPRRFEPEAERQSTHPSLSRRIQAIRRIGGVAPAPIEPRAFAGDGVPRAVIFEAERLVLVSFSGDRPELSDPAGLLLRATHVDAIAYTDLTDIRFDARRDGGATLVAADRRGELRRIRIADADAPAIRVLMDLVDQRLAPPPPAPHVPQLLGRMVALAALLVVIPGFAWGVVATAFMALVRPTVPLLAAIAAGSLVAAVLSSHRVSSPLAPLALVLIALCAVAVVVRGLRTARTIDVPFRWDGVLVAGAIVTTAAALVPVWLIVALGHGSLERLHIAARNFPTASAGCAALGAFLVVVPRRLSRLTGGLAFASAAAIGAVGSTAFRDRFAPDPLIATAPALEIDSLPGMPVQRLVLDGTHWTVRLAPDARHVLLAAAARSGTRAPIPFVLAAFDGWRRTLVAQDARFIDADTILTVTEDGPAHVLTAESIRGGTVRWTLRLGGPPSGVFEVDANGRWRLDRADLDDEGNPEDVLAAAGVEGRVGDAGVHPTTVPRLVLHRHWSGGGHPLAWMLPELGWTATLARAASPGAARILARTRLMLDCRGPSLGSAHATCLARTGDDTFLWDVDVDRGTLSPLATATGVFTPVSHDDRLLLAWRDDDILALWRGTSHAVRLGSHGHCPCPHDASAAKDRLATLTSIRDRTTVALYAITPPGAAPAR